VGMGYASADDELDINGRRLRASPVSGVSSCLFLSLPRWRKLVALGSHSCSVISALVVLEVFSGFRREHFRLLPELSG
jgi:hypothetical protein